MQFLVKNILHGVAALAIAVTLTGLLPGPAAFAQAAPLATDLSQPTIKALQDALSKQGIAVKADGVLNDETRAAIRKYQSQHHLPVTGEPDKATLDKLGVRQSATPQPPTVAQATPAPPPAQAPTGPGGMSMNCPMMQEAMPGMMQMMQGMTGMMRGMQTQPQQSEQMEQMQGMMRGMMQMMQGMMGMMQSTQMMQPRSAQPGAQNN